MTSFIYGVQEKEGSLSQKTIDASGNTSVQYTDANGNVLKTVDYGNGKIEPISTSYSYDEKNNLVQETYSNGDYRIHEYDEESQLLSVTSYRNDKKTMVTKYTYNSTGQISTMLDYRFNGSKEELYRYTAYGYDELDQLIEFAEFSGSTIPTEKELSQNCIRYSYDLDGKVTDIRYAKSHSGVVGLRHIYDVNGRETEIYAIMQNNENNLLRSYEYAASGELLEVRDYQKFTQGNTDDYICKKYFYDDYLRVTAIEYSESNFPDIVRESYEYAYDNNSNIVKETIFNDYPEANEEKMNETRTYKYDNLGRLLSTVVNDNNTSKTSLTTYVYDKVGNRLKMTVDGEETSYKYNSLNQMTSSEKKKNNRIVSQISYMYDLRGNLVEETDQKTTTAVKNNYDVEGQLEKQTVYENDVIRFSQLNDYNGNGQRIKKVEDSETTNYYYQEDAVYSSIDESGKLLSFNLLEFDNSVIASERIQDDGTGLYYFYHKDAKGSSTTILSADDTTAVTYRYGDFGETEIRGGESFYNEICYASGIYDKSTGLYYLNARYYDPNNGRFLSQDTKRGTASEPDTWNLYAYCANNPVNFVDYNGHSISLGSAAIAALYVATIIYGIYSTYKIVYTNLFYTRWTGVINYDAETLGSNLDGIAGTYSWIVIRSREVAGKVKASFVKMKSISRTYRSKRETHHIVPVKHSRARRAREVLIKMNFRYKSDSRNLVVIKTGLHRRLHTNYYVDYVNRLVTSAYKKGLKAYGRKNDEKTGGRWVIRTLANLKRFVRRLDYASPY